ncbi:MAG TPA: hypothetical protein VEV15_10435, partial [Flavisolibacter sp.]|nr:hypothetical protein [Flavisolibacter sp.]
KEGGHPKRARNIRPLQGRGVLPHTELPVAPAVMHVEALQASPFLSTLSLNLIVVWYQNSKVKKAFTH